MRFDRRVLLRWLPPSLAALLVPGCATVAAKPSKSEPEPEPEVEAPPEEIECTYDVAIVGAGVAGCYAGYRLLHGDLEPSSPLAPLKAASGGKLKVGLFEYSGRAGGRLLSARIPGVDEGPRNYAEFGGFRYQKQMHIVRDLAENLLGLTPEPFPVDEPPQNFVYLRGKRFKRCQIFPTNPNPSEYPELPYNLRPSELEMLKNGDDLTEYVGDQALPADADGPKYTDLRSAYQKAIDAEDWAAAAAAREQYETKQQRAIVDGRPFTEWSWWALMSNFLSEEAIAFLEDSGGYNSLYSTGNAATGLVEDFYFSGPADTYPDIYGPGHQPTPEEACEKTAWVHVTSGYSDIPNMLYQRFTDAGGDGFFNHQLLGFDKDATDGCYTLRFFKRESGTLSSGQGEAQVAADPQSSATVKAKFLILALPKQAMRDLDRSTFFFQSPTVNQLLDSVLQVPAMRIFLAYPEPWWTQTPGLPDLPAECTTVPYDYNVPPTCGRNTTDLPVRQFYFWHSSTDAANPRSSVLASYTNAEAEKYWKSLQIGPGHDSLPGSVHEPDRHDGAQGHGPRTGSKTMARLAHQQIMEVLGVEETTVDGKVWPPEPYYAHFQNWTKNPWGGGWHAWVAGSNYDELIPEILQPLPDENIFICGEAYSNIQGWVQGALNTSEVMLQKRLGLTYPSSWLTPGGTWLGPGSDGIPTT